MFYSVHQLRHLRFIIGRNIRFQRDCKELTVQQLAQESGISEDRLNAFERGKNDIRLIDLLKIACVLELEVFELVG